MSEGRPRGSARARAALAAGALAGVALAALSLVRSGDEPRPATIRSDDAVAWVEGEPIARETYARFVAAVARERGTVDLDPDTRRALLDQLIDEELLLREGIELGLARREPGARRAIVSAVIELVTTDEGPAEPSSPELEALYTEMREQWKPLPGDSAEPPPLETVRPELRAEWLRRRHDERLRAHLAKLRGEADVRIAEPELERVD
jgi:hypothetical protein